MAPLLAVLVVMVFPSAAVSGTVTTILNPTADAYVNRASPTTNYGSALALNVGANPTMRSYLKFSIPRLNSGALRATLRLYANSSSATGFQVRSAGNGWSENTITYANQPSRSEDATASSGPVTAGQWVELNVSSLVNENSTRTFALTGSAVSAVALASDEDTSHRPQLVVRVDDTAAPSVQLVLPFNNSRVGPRPTFAGLAGNSDGDLPTVTVKIYSGSTPTGPVVQTVFATRGTLNIWSTTAASALPNGTYTARAEQQDNAGNTGFSSPRVFRVDSVIVSIMFDDGTANQYQARAMLAAHGGMDATFFVNSSVISTNPNYMTWDQLHGLASDGSEIAGHTMFHADLTASDPAEAGRQVCYDRNNLLAHQFKVTNFAFPFGSYNDSAKALVKGCGFNSARGTESFEGLCAPLCSESIPPADPYATRVAGFGPDGLTALQNRVMDAENNGGGWVQLLFHGLCTNCGVNGLDPATFNAFLNWLQPRAADGTVVRTVQWVIGGEVQPRVEGPPLPDPPTTTTNVIRNPSLEQDTNNDGTPDCYRTNSFGQHQAVWTRTNDKHTGSWAMRVDSTNFVDGADILQTWDDLGYCTPTVTPGKRYTLSTWYKSTAPVRFSTNRRLADFSSPFPFWLQSDSGLVNNPVVFPASDTWAQATWTTPEIPAGTTGMLFGLLLTSEGSLTVDDVSIVEASP